MAALSSIPWVSSLIGATASLSGEAEQGRINDLHRLWLEDHQQRAQELLETLMGIFKRLDSFGDEVDKRMQSPEFLSVVRRLSSS